MHQVHITHLSSKSLSFWWEYMSDIKSYEKTVPLISDITIHTFGKKNAYWEDTTRIMVVPRRIKHYIIVWKPRKKIIYETPDSSGGKVTEVLQLRSNNKITEVTGIVTADFPKGFVFAFLEWFLTTRLKYMVEKMFKNIEDL